MMDADASHQELGLYLHRQLLAGDPTATARIAEEFWPYVESRLSLRFPRLDDPHLVQTAIVDAILNYFQRPGQFNPDKSSLRAYLYMSARGDLLNALERTRAEPQKVNLVEDVELEDGEALPALRCPLLVRVVPRLRARCQPGNGGSLPAILRRFWG